MLVLKEIPPGLVLMTWLEGHLLRCPFKYLTGVDCPGCGFQRAVMALMRGHLHQSFSLYPATIPLLFIVLYTIAGKFIIIDNHKNVTKKFLYISVASIILISYSIKMIKLYA